MGYKKFSEQVQDCHDLSRREVKDLDRWIQTGLPPLKNRRDIDDEWFDEMQEADCKHGQFIKIVGKKFDEKKVGVSDFTILLLEYFSINNSESIEYQEIKSEWGYLMDFNAIVNTYEK